MQSKSSISTATKESSTTEILFQSGGDYHCYVLHKSCPAHRGHREICLESKQLLSSMNPKWWISLSIRDGSSLALSRSIRNTRRFSSDTRHASLKSHVLWKLQHYIDTGQLKKKSDAQYSRKTDATAHSQKRGKSILSPHKILLILRAKFEQIPLQTKTGEVIEVHGLQAHNLQMKNPMLAKIFDALMEFQRISRKKVDKKLVLALLGATPELTSDSYFVAKDVLTLLDIDDNFDRSLVLCRLAKENGLVGMNAIVEWCLRRGRIEDAKRILMLLKKWAIPYLDYSHVVYFNGLSELHLWGSVSEETAKHVSDLMSDSTTPKNLSTFNAALNVLMKNFNGKQAKAWLFFDKMESLHIRPDCQTFTIFLQGVRKFYSFEADSIKRDRNLSSVERARKLFENQANLVSIANEVFNKLKDLATPPKVPSRLEVEKNPTSMTEYKKEIRRQPVDIDAVFVTTFLQCFSDDNMGTGYNFKHGSHYRYIQQMVMYMKLWVPEINDIINFIQNGKYDINSTSILRLLPLLSIDILPSKDLRRRTDELTERAQIIDRFNPSMFLKNPVAEEVNPLFVFPPSPFSKQKNAAIFSNVKRPLVDLARAPFGEVFKQYQRKVFYDTKGKLGIKYPERRIHRRMHSVNKFLLRIFLDGILQLGLRREYYLGIWYSIFRWGSVPVQLQRISENRDLSFGAFSHPEKNCPTESRSVYPVDESECPLDIKLIENFIFKFEEYSPKSSDCIPFAVELLGATTFHSSGPIRCRKETFDFVFSLLNRSLHRIFDSNREKGRSECSKKSAPNNTPRKPISSSQIELVLQNLNVVMNYLSSLSWLSKEFLGSYKLLIEQIVKSTWVDAPIGSKTRLELQKQIINSVLSLWRPDGTREQALGSEEEVIEDNISAILVILSEWKNRAEIIKINDPWVSKFSKIDLKRENVALINCLKELKESAENQNSF